MNKKSSRLSEEKSEQGALENCWSQEAKCTVLWAIALGLIAHSLRCSL